MGGVTHRMATQLAAGVLGAVLAGLLPAGTPDAPPTVPDAPDAERGDRLRPPAAQLLLAGEDVFRIDSHVRRDVRYVDAGDLDEQDREEAFLAYAGQLLGFSRNRFIVRPQAVPGSRASLYRVNLAEYGLDPGVWDDLARVNYAYYEATRAGGVEYDFPAAGTDPADPRWKVVGGKKHFLADDGKHYEARRYTRPARGAAAAIGFWVVPTDLHRKVYADLCQETGAKAPIVRLARSFYECAVDQDRVAGYRRMLGVATLDDFEREFLAAGGNAVRAAVAFSGVTQDVRGYVRRDGRYGGYWTSIDFRRAVGPRNALKVTGEDLFDQGQFFETLALNACGMLVTALNDDQRKLQDVAPNFVAGDSTASRHDFQVHNGLCVRCHQEGFRPIPDFHRGLLRSEALGEHFREQVKDRRFRDEHLSPLEEVLAADRKRYTEAVKAATGWTTAEYSAAYGRLYSRTDDKVVDLAGAERDTGIPREQIRAAILDALKRGRENFALAALVAGPGLPQRQWEEEYAVFQKLYAEYVP